MRKLLAVLLTLCLLPLAGCYDAVDLNEQIFAVNLALDIGTEAPLCLTVQYPQIVPNGREPAQGNENLQKNGYVLHQVQGETPQQCLQLLRMVTPRRLSLMQLRGLYLSDALAQDQALLQSCIDALTGEHTARPAAHLYITRGRAEEVLRAQLPLFGARLSKAQGAQTAALQHQGVIPEATLGRFSAALREGTGGSAILAAVNGQDHASAQAAQPAALLAGDLPRRTADDVDLCGCALMGKNGLLLLTGYETQLLNLLTGDLRKPDLLADGADAEVTLRRAPRITVETCGETPCITVRLPLHIHAEEASPHAERLLQDVTALLLKLQQNGLDPLNLAARARAKVLTLRAWRQLDWSTLYAKAVWVVGLN